MIVKSRLYRTLAIVVSFGLLVSLLPQPVWQGWIGAETAQAAPATNPLTPQTATDEVMQSLQEALPPDLAASLTGMGALGPDGQPNGMLMDAGAMQNFAQTPPQEPEALANPITVSRVQSAYAASAAISNTLLVTFTVTNNRPPVNLPQLDPNASITDTIEAVSSLDFSNDPNVIRNVLLTDELLPPQASFISASPYPDRNGNVFAWNLGDIPPLGNITMTLKLTVPSGVLDFTELDTGATVWGTLQGRAVTDGTAPIALAPDGFDGWLVCTIDANCNDEYVIEKAAELGNDPIAIFEYVKSLGFESYKGSLRGARGTLWSEAGNSVDKASLLIALLRASGIPTAYRHGTLETPLAQQLILSMFPEPTSIIGHIPPGTETADPANDPQLLAETYDHWWVQAYLPGLGWTQLDPNFTNAAIGQSLVPFPSPDQLPEVPDNLRHKITIKVKVEEYHPLNFGGPSSGLANSYPLVYVLNSVELVGNPVTLHHFVNTQAQGGAIFYYVKHSYIPYLVIGEFERTIEGQPFQELISNFPFGTFLTTGEWLILESQDPDGNVNTQVHEVFDVIGAEARQSGGTITVAANSDTKPKVSELDGITVLVNTSSLDLRVAHKSLTDLMTNWAKFLSHKSEMAPLLNRSDLSSEEQAALHPFIMDARQIVRRHNTARLFLFSVVDDGLINYGDATLVHAYSNVPRFLLANNQLVFETNNTTSVHIEFDLLYNNYRMIAGPRQNQEATIAFRAYYGMLQTAAEGVIHENIFGISGVSTISIFQAANEQGIDAIALSTNNEYELQNLEISDAAKARIIKDIQSGYTVVVPRSMVSVGNVTTIGWWRIDLESGETIGVLENGQHGFGEYAAAFGMILLIAGVLTYGMAHFLEWVENAWGYLAAAIIEFFANFLYFLEFAFFVSLIVALLVTIPMSIFAFLVLLVVLVLLLAIVMIIAKFAGAERGARCAQEGVPPFMCDIFPPPGGGNGGGGNGTATPTVVPTVTGTPTVNPTATPTPPIVPPTNTPPPPTPSDPCPGIAIVQPGDTVFRIALRAATTVEAIVACNPWLAPDPSLIYPGQELKLPPPNTGGSLPSLIPIVDNQENPSNSGDLTIASSYTKIDVTPIPPLNSTPSTILQHLPDDSKRDFLAKAALTNSNDVEDNISLQSTVPNTLTTPFINQVPLPPAQLNPPQMNLSQSIEPATAVVYQGIANLTNGPLTVDIETEHGNFAGYMTAGWQNNSQTGLPYTTLETTSAIVKRLDGTLVGSGPVKIWSVPLGSRITLSGSNISYDIEGWGQFADYAPSTSGLNLPTNWANYVVTITAGSFDPLIVNPYVLSIGDDYYGFGEYVVELNGPVVIEADKESNLMPSFATQWQAQASAASIRLAPGTGTASLNSQILDLDNGVIATGFDGTITISEQTTIKDRIQLAGSIAQLIDLDVLPTNSSTTPFQSTNFQIDVLSNLTDTYYLEVSGPSGWDIELNSTGAVTVTPGINVAQPDDYTFVVVAQSYTRPELIISTEHIVTIAPHQGMNLDVAENSAFTVAWGRANPNAFPGNTNNGQLQLPGAAFTIDITNTSTVSHTFNVEVTGLPTGWLLLSGAEGQTETTLSLPAGGVGQIGLYISPTLTSLPPAGTEFPFTVTAVDLEGAGLSQSDGETFTVPAIAFNQITADPPLIFASPNTTTTFDISLTNVGNVVGEFPIAITLPLTTWTQLSSLNTPVSVNAGETDEQTVVLGVPADALLGNTYAVQISSPAPGTAYTQTTFASIEIVSANTLPIYQAAQTVADLFPDEGSLVAALQFLGQAINDLEQSCQSGSCDLELRDRVVSGAEAVANHAEPISPLLTAVPSLHSTADAMATHTTPSDLLADNITIRDLVLLLQAELEAVASHNLNVSFEPGLLVALENRPAHYNLQVRNEGSLTTTAVLTLTAPATSTASWNTQTVILSPGETISVPAVITPTLLGSYLLQVDAETAESSLIHQQAFASLVAVDSLLQVPNVMLSPAFVEYNAGTPAAVWIQVANVANIPIAGHAQVQLLAANGTEIASFSTPITAESSLAPLGYNLGNIDTTGLLTGTYTVTVNIVDDTGTLIPKATGHGFLAIGQAVEASIGITPVIVAPGDITATITITTELSQAVLDMIAISPDQIEHILAARLLRQSKINLAPTTLPLFDPSDPYTVTLTANPTQITADGTSTATLSVYVQNQSGAAVADGTQVIFTADGGSLTTPITTTTLAGQAQATLTAGTVARTTDVTATAGISNTTGTAQVEFVAGPATDLVLNAVPAEATALQPFPFMVAAYDAFGNVATNYAGTVNFTSSDGRAGLPSGPTNVALNLPPAQLSASSQYNSSYSPANAVDGNASTDWASAGQTSNAWIQLSFTAPVPVNRVILRDRANTTDSISVSRLEFSDGSTVDVGSLPNNGALKSIYFNQRMVSWVRYYIQVGGGSNIGVSEFEVYSAHYSFTAVDNGQHTFNGTLLATAGSQTLTVSDINNASLTDSSTITVLPGVLDLTTSQITVTTPHLADGLDTATVLVTARDAAGNGIPDVNAWLLVTGEGNTLAALSGITNANGVFTTTLTSTEAGAKAIRVLLDDGQTHAWLAQSPIIEFTRSAITGYVFSDSNRDGIRQGGEAGLGGVQLVLYESGTNEPAKMTVTDNDGRYSFTSLTSDTYRLEQAPLDQYAFSNGGVLTATVGDFITLSDIDFGNYASAHVSGQVWNDGNQDGLRQSSELSLSGVTVNATDSGSQLVDSATTAADGTYQLEIAADLPAAPSNFVFNSGGLAIEEPATAVIGNSDFDRGTTLLAPATYPTNYNFATGSLGDWTTSNTTYVTVVNDALSYDGHYLFISSYGQSAYSPAFTVPANAQSLSFNFYNSTWRDTATARPLYVYALTGSDFSVSTYLGAASASKMQAWQTAVMDIQALQGQTIKLRFLADTDSYWQGVSRFDNIALNTQVPDWTFDNALYTAVMNDAYSQDGPYLRISSYNHSTYSAPFVIPTDAQSLRFAYLNSTWRDSAAARPLHVYLLSGTNFATSTYLGAANGSLTQGWLTAILDIQAFQGQTVKLRFLTDTDSYWQGVSRLDDVTLYTEVPGWSPGNVAYVYIGEDAPTGQTEITSPENPDFSQGLTLLETASYPGNYDFAVGRTALPTSTYPVNYNFNGGNLSGWTVSNATYVTAVNNVYSLDGHYLNLGSYSQYADTSAFVLPANAQSLRFNYTNRTWRDSNAGRPVHAYVLSGPDFGTVTHIGSGTGSEIQGWLTAVLDIQAFRGQTIKLRFYADTDSYWQGTSRVDNLSLETETPDWAISHSTYVQIVDDTYGLSGSGNYLRISSYGQSATSLSFTVPQDAQSLNFNYANSTWRDSSAGRPIHVYVLNGPDFSITTHIGSASGSARQGWLTATLDIQAYQGQTVKLYFVADTDSYWQGTSRLDNVRLSLQVPGWDLSNASNIQVQESNPPVNPPVGFSNGDFSIGRTPLSVSTYPVNYDFSDMRVPLDPATYPANYNFASGNLGGWSASNPTYVQVISNTYSQDGYYLRLGSYSQYSDSPAFIVPTNTHSLRFQYHNATWRDNNASRPLHVYVLSGPDLTTVTHIGSASGSNNNGWLSGALDLQPYQGQTIKLRFYADTDSYWQGTSRVDDVTLHTDLPDGWRPSNVSHNYVQIISDTYNLNGPYLGLNSYSQYADTPAFIIPDTAQTLHFSYRNATWRDANASRPVHVYVLSGPNLDITTHIGSGNGAANEGWKSVQLDIQSFQGQLVKLRFYADTDSYWQGTSRVDNISLNTEAPNWVLSNASVSRVQATGGIDGNYLLLDGYGISVNPQPFMVPTNVDSIQFSYSTWTWRDANASRPLHVYAYIGDNFSIPVYLGAASGSQNEGWKTATLSMANVRGRYIKLVFVTDTDSYWQGHSQIDNIALVTGAGGSPLGTDYNEGGTYISIPQYGSSIESIPFLVPNNADSISFDYYNWTWRDGGAARPLHVYALSGPGFGLATYLGGASGSALTGWKNATMSLSGFRGQVIKLRFLTDTDSYWQAVSKLDSIVLNLGPGSGGTLPGSNDSTYLTIGNYNTRADSAAFTVPAGTQSVRFNYANQTWRDPNASRPLHVYALTGPTFGTANYLGAVSSSALQGWREGTLNLSAYQGQTIKLRFLTDTDSYWQATSRIDNVYLLPLTTTPIAISEINPVNYTSSTPDTVNVNAYGGAAFTINFGDFAVDRYQSTVEVAPLAVTANGVATAVVTVTLRDGSGNPLPGYEVEIAAPGTAVSINQPSASTNAAGQAIGTITSTRTQQVQVTARSVTDNVTLAQAVTLTFVAGLPAPDNSILTVSPTSVIANGINEALFTVTLLDAYNNPVPGKTVDIIASGTAVTFTLNITQTNAQGQVTGSVRSSVAQTVTLQAIDTTDQITVTQTADILFTSTDPQLSSVTANPTTLVADSISSATITVTLRDQNGDPLAGKPIALVVAGADSFINGQPVSGIMPIGNSGPDGMVTAVLTATTPGLKTISAYGDGILLDEQAQVMFTVGTVDVNASTLQTDLSTLTANGITYATMTATLYDSYGHVVPGKTVAIQASGTDVVVTQPQTQTNAQGQVQATVRSSTVQTATITAIDQTDGLTLTQVVILYFVPGPADAAQSTAVITPTTVLADGVQTTTLTITLRDALGHPATNRAAQLVVGGSHNTVTPATQGITDQNGTIVFHVASTTAETKQLSVRDVINNVLVPIGQVEFVFGTVDPDASQLQSNKTTIGADGVDAATVTATLYDSYGHPVPGKTVLIQSTGNITLSQPVTTTNSQGRVQATISATEIQSVTVTAIDQTDGITLPQSLVLNFVPGAADATHSTITVNPTTAVANNVATIIVDATLQDALNHPLANQPVRLVVSGSGNTIAPAVQTNTDGAGHVVFTLTASRAEVKNLALRDVNSGVELPLGQVTFIPGPADATHSTVTANTTTVPADGTTPITLTIQVLDAFNNPIQGANVTLLAAGTGFTLNQPTTPTGANGRTTGTVTGTTFNPVTVQATADGLPLNASVTLHFDGADLVVTKNGPTIGIVGRPVTYTLTIVNQGLMIASGVELSDVLPDALTFVSQSGPYSMTQNAQTLVWQVGNLAVGQTAEVTLVALVNSAAILGEQVTNQAQATAVSEENTTNNSDSASFNVVPGYESTLSLNPVSQTAALGGVATYEVAVRNTGNLADTFDLSISGLNPAWYTFSTTSLTLQPGEIGTAPLSVQVNDCGAAGTYPVYALAGSSGVGNTQTVAGELTLTANPLITNLLPANNAAIGATSALFTWQTAVTGTTSIFLRPVGSPFFTEYTGAPGTLHQVDVNGLTRNVNYEWYARTVSNCGSEDSPVNTLSVLNGVVFTQRSFNFNVNRDYNQQVSVAVYNQDVISHTVVVSIENSYPELIVGFIGEGSIDDPFVLQPGQTRVIQLGIHTQDVTQSDFTLAARLTADDGGSTPIQDAVPVNLHVHIPNFNFSIEEIGSDPQTLVKTYRVRNFGDPLTDLAITAQVTGTGSLYLLPGMSHGYLGTNQSFTFEAIPVADSSFTGLSGVVQATAAGVVTETAVSLTLPAGTNMYLGEADDVSMEARTADWYCTNRPVIQNKLILPTGFRRADVSSARFLFNINSAWTGVRPHDVHIYLNDYEVGALENVIPHGLYTFPVEATYLNESAYGPSVNYIKLVTTHMNGGHYVVATDMAVSICLTNYREWVAATSQTEADQIVSSRSFLIPAPTTLDVDILEPLPDQVLTAGNSVTVKMRVNDDVTQPLWYEVTMQADNGNGGLILYDDGVHGDGGYRDGIYANTWTPLNTGPTTLTIHAGSCTIAGDSQVTVQILALDHDVNVSHFVPVTGTAVLTHTITPAPVATNAGPDETEVDWAHTLTAAQPTQENSLQLLLPDMQPGEVRQVSNGTVISYTGPGGTGLIHLPPLYVTARHLVAITPAKQTVSLGGSTEYQVSLYNPGSTANTFTLAVTGLPVGWADLPDTVSLAAYEQATLPLTVTASADSNLGDYPFAVVVTTANGGQDQAGALLHVADLLNIAVSPALMAVGSGGLVTYTVTITNLETAVQTYDLSVDGLSGSQITLPSQVTVSAGEAVTVPLQVVAYEAVGPHPFDVQATVQDSGANQTGDAVMAVIGDRRVAAGLSPVSNVAGPGVPVSYTLTITNSGSLSDTYQVTTDLPAGWSYRLDANGSELNTLRLTPYVFNVADLLLIVTPAATALPGDYDFTVRVQSQNNPNTQATVGGEAIVTEYGVTVQIDPNSTTMSPDATGTWQVTVTNVGSQADSYTLTAGGIVADGEFSQNPVSLAPGQSQTVQLTAENLEFTLPQTYPVEVEAQSLFDSQISNYDTAEVTFTGYEAVEVGWLPVTQVLTDTPEATFMLLITNTGNVSTIYDLSLNTPGLSAEMEIEQLYIPPHMTAGILVTVRATTAGTYLITGQANSTTSAANGSSVATLVVEVSAVQHPPVATDDLVATLEDTAVIIPVLSNDTDADGDPLTVGIQTSPAHGTAVINPDNSVTYTPTANFYGSDVFTYTISDGYNSDTAHVTVVVASVNDNPTALDDTATTLEDTAVMVSVLSNDSDIENDSLTVESVTSPAFGAATINPDNSVTYTPDQDYNSTDSFDGTDVFTYTVNDGNGGTDSAMVTIIVTPVNDAPVAVDDNATTPEDTAVPIAILANDLDVDGDVLTVESLTQPANGTAVLNLDNTVTYTPSTNFYGTVVFSYTIVDGQGGTDTAQVTVVVVATNDAPTAVDDSATTLEDTAVTITVLANDSDADGDTLTLDTLTPPANGTAVINPDNTVTYTPTAHFHGTDSFAYTIQDGSGDMDTAVVTVQVTPVNDAPVATDDTVATDEDTAVVVAVLANDSDVDGDTLTVDALTLPANGTAVVNPDNTVTYTPNANFNGVDSFSYTVNDGHGGSDTATITVAVATGNDNPVATDDTADTDEDTAVTISVLDNDNDPDGDSLAIDTWTPPANGTAVLNPDNTITYTPNPNFNGADSFTYTVLDGFGGSDTATVVVHVTAVNDVPVTVDDIATTPEDTTVVVNVLANDSDVDGDILTVESLTPPASGTAVVNPDYTITYTPTTNFNGTDSFAYTVNDGHGGTNTAVLTITVTPLNDFPVAEDDGVSTPEDTAVTIPVLANDSDVDGDSLSITAVTTATNGLVTIQSDGSLTYNPTANFNGADSFVYTISDGNGGSDTATVAIAVSAVNDAPDAVDDDASTPEDTAVIVVVLANDSDVDGDALMVDTITPPAHGTAVINPDYTVTYTPTASFNGTDSFAYTISDGNSMDTAVVTVQVASVNDAPDAVDDAIATGEDTAVLIDVLANDGDSDGDTLTVESLTIPGHGTAIINPDNTVTYTPNNNFNGVDSFTYTITDGHGGSDTAAVVVTVMPGNDNPEAADDAATTNEDTAVLINVLANDDDPDSDTLVLDSLTPPANGTAVINPDNTVTYTPQPNFNGVDSFTYTIVDGFGGSDTASVTVTVVAVNDAPVAEDDTATTPAGTAVTIPVLNNDSDIEGDMLTLEGLTTPGHGTAVINPEGTVTYTPAGGFSGTDSFNYTISDGHGGSDMATITILVTPVSGSCELYPIALQANAIANAQPGDIVTDIFHGTQPGNFGWLTWSGQIGTPLLIASLTPPGTSHTYNNPYNPDDHVVSIGDWVPGKPGLSNAQNVRDALDVLKTMDIVVPVWDVTSGRGNHSKYHIVGFALVRLISYDLPGQDVITAQFLGNVSCGDN